VDDYLEEMVRAGERPFQDALADANLRAQLLKSLTAMRQARDISQTEVARRMGTTQSAISDLEGGGTDPRISTLQRYARAIGCQVILTWEATE
jgi:predicted transcriptional regulator